MSLAHIAYRILTASLTPCLPLWLRRRAAKGQEDTARLPERYGRASLARPKGQLFWMHGVSVGETTMLLPVIDALLETYPKAHILMTSGTLTSAQLMAQRLPQSAFHQYIPLDRKKWVMQFLDHWQPDLAIWAESEIWPNLVLATQARGVPMALLNARLSQKSLQGWAKRGAFAAQIFKCFDYIQAADTQTAAGLSKIIGTDLAVFANLKEASNALPFDTIEHNKLAAAIGTRPVWCAASTHVGEDEIILHAHAEILKTHPTALLLLAPRHPERREDILAFTQDSPHMVGLHTRSDKITPQSSIYMFDTIGDMGLAFSLSGITLMCGSLIDGLYGHNPLEPARQNNAVLTGPHLDSFKDIYQDMFAFGAADTILDDMSLAHTISNLFSGPETLAAKQAKAYRFAQSRKAILDQTITALTALLHDKAAS